MSPIVGATASIAAASRSVSPLREALRLVSASVRLDKPAISLLSQHQLAVKDLASAQISALNYTRHLHSMIWGPLDFRRHALLIEPPVLFSQHCDIGVRTNAEMTFARVESEMFSGVLCGQARYQRRRQCSLMNGRSVKGRQQCFQARYA